MSDLYIVYSQIQIWGAFEDFNDSEPVIVKYIVTKYLSLDF